MIKDFPLTHRALVCSRMDLFTDLNSVSALSTHEAYVPTLSRGLDELPEGEARSTLEDLFPVFLHNLIRADAFPLQKNLIGALEQMEQNIRDHADNPFVQELLTCGLKGEVFNADGLPQKTDAKRAVSLYLARTEWDTLYRTFSLRIVKAMLREKQSIAAWMRVTRSLEQAHTLQA